MRFHTYGPPPVAVTSADQVEPLVRRCLDAKMLGVDTETLGLFDKKKYGSNLTDQLVVCGLCPGEDTRILVPRRWVTSFREVLESEHIVKAAHNITFDAHRFANMGIKLGGPWCDSLHLDWMADEDTRENRHKLDHCMLDYFDIALGSYRDLFGRADPREFKPGHPQWEQYLDYATLDPWAHLKLAKYLLGYLAEWEIEPGWSLEDHYWDIEEGQIKALWDMERTGIVLDEGAAEEVSRKLQLVLDEKSAELSVMCGRIINPGSTQQVVEYFFDAEKGLGIEPLAYTGTGAPQADEKVLKKLRSMGYEEAQVILDFRSAQKMKGTYADGLRNRLHTDGRVHTTYRTTMLTGRLSSADPNLQNVPSGEDDIHGFRTMFVATPGYKLIINDYSQLEMCVLAHIAGEKSMADAIGNGMDMHCFVAASMYGYEYDFFFQKAKAEKDPEFVTMRSDAKAIGFGILYGKGAYSLARDFKITEGEAQAKIDKFLNTFPGVRDYIAESHAMAKELGYVMTITGRPRRLSAIYSQDFRTRKEAERQAQNSVIQGSAADIVKKALVLLHQDARLKALGFRLLLQVHDEIIGEAPEENAEESARIVQQYMEDPFIVPLDVRLSAKPDICDNWKEAK